MKSFLDYLKEADEMEDQTSTEGKNGENSEYEEQKKMGLNEEKEHLNIYKLFSDLCAQNNIDMPIDEEEYLLMIVDSHLKEDKNYYSKLKECFKPSDETEVESESEEEME